MVFFLNKIKDMVLVLHKYERRIAASCSELQVGSGRRLATLCFSRPINLAEGRWAL